MIKLLATVALALAGVLTVPRAAQPLAVPAPVVAPVPPPAPGPPALSFSTRFEITGSAKQYHYDTKTVLKSKTFTTKVKSDDAKSCIKTGCFGLSPSDPKGKAYVFYDSQSSWRFATNKAGTGATTVTGQVGADGRFHMSGVEASTDTAIMLTGKVKFLKNTLTPIKIEGKFISVTRSNPHASEGKFKTEGTGTSV